jgi:hypothetical protein
MNHSKNPYYVNLASVPLDGDSLLEFGDAYSRYLMYRGHGEEAARKLSSDAITMKLHLIFRGFCIIASPYKINTFQRIKKDFTPYFVNI